MFLTMIHIKKKAQLARKKTCTNGKRRNEKKSSGWQTQADQRWRPPGTGGARMWANKSVSCSNVEAPQRLKLLLWGLQCELIKPGGALGDPNLLTEPLLCLLLYVVRPIYIYIYIYHRLYQFSDHFFYIPILNIYVLCGHCSCSVVDWTIGHVVSVVSFKMYLFNEEEKKP